MRKRDSRGKSTENFCTAFKRLNRRKLLDLPLQIELNKLKRLLELETELELINVVDRFLHGHGNFDSNLVPFKMKSL